MQVEERKNLEEHIPVYETSHLKLEFNTVHCLTYGRKVGPCTIKCKVLLRGKVKRLFAPLFSDFCVDGAQVPYKTEKFFGKKNTLFKVKTKPVTFFRVQLKLSLPEFLFGGPHDFRLEKVNIDVCKPVFKRGCERNIDAKGF